MPQKYESGIPPDTGCKVAPKCLECPLPQCRYDEPWGYQKLLLRQRDQAVIAAMEQDGLNVDQAAERFGLVVRTIYHIMRKAKEL